jgi:hypothetical protein
MAGILYPEEEPGALARPATVNPLIARQVAAQRAAYPRTQLSPDKALGMGSDLLTMVPGIGDAWGLARDVREYATNPDSRTLGNYGLSVLGLLPFMPGMTVFHGSPHKFDKFDMSKVGTGEGAQAYGHGLYFAENPGVARSYSNVGQPSWRGPTTYGHVQTALETAKVNGLSGPEAKKFALSYLNDRAKAAPDFARQQFYDAANNFDELAKGGAGNLYKVDLPDEHIAKMLDWDKPLSQQPGIVPRSLLNEIGSHRWNLGVMPDDPTGHQLVQAMQRMQKSQAEISETMRRAGIPGIKYLDQGSRAGGKGTSNFVVFDDQLPKIVGRE